MARFAFTELALTQTNSNKKSYTVCNFFMLSFLKLVNKTR